MKAHENRAPARRRHTIGLLIAVLGCASIAPWSGEARGDDPPKVRWRNITRERLPQDVAAVALEYTVILAKDGQERTIDPNSHQFEVGDRILVRIEPKDDLYIYIFTEGPTGDRSCLLPESDGKPQFVKKGKVIELPDDGFLRFDEPPGEEKLIVVATAEPSQDLAALAHSVFKKPDAQLTPKEKAEKAKIKQQHTQTMNSTYSQKVAGARLRGVLSQASVDKFNEDLSVKKRGVIEEPPHGDESSTFAMALADKTAGAPELLIDIPLKSVARANAAK